MDYEQIHLGDAALCKYCGELQNQCECKFLTVVTAHPFGLLEYYRRLMMSPWN